MGFGLYIHYPYCRRICPFCDFVTARKSRREESADQDRAYASGLVRELDMLAPLYQGDPALWGRAPHKLDTVYFGGGTPSLCDPQALEIMLQAIRRAFDLSPTAEVTLEADPKTVTADGLQALQELGINRLSLGVQSFDDATLKLLGRGYNGAAAHELLQQAIAAGPANLSVDLMYGLPRQSASAWARDLAALLSYGDAVKHVSLYCLTLEADSRFHRVLHVKGLAMPSEELQRSHYELAMDFLQRAGFDHYEISSWGRPGCWSRHNSAYWQGRPYLGLGVGAHSYHIDTSRSQVMCFRWSNVDDVATYLGMLARGEQPVDHKECLSKRQRALEFMMLRLRLRGGIRQAELDLFLSDAPPEYGELIEEMCSRQLLSRDQQGLRLTDAGIMISNEIFTRFA